MCLCHRNLLELYIAVDVRNILVCGEYSWNILLAEETFCKGKLRVESECCRNEITCCAGATENLLEFYIAVDVRNILVCGEYSGNILSAEETFVRENFELNLTAVGMRSLVVPVPQKTCWSFISL